MIGTIDVFITCNCGWKFNDGGWGWIRLVLGFMPT